MGMIRFLFRFLSRIGLTVLISTGAVPFAWAKFPNCWLKVYRSVPPGKYEYSGRIFLDRYITESMEKDEVDQKGGQRVFSIMFGLVPGLGLYYTNSTARDLDLHQLIHGNVSDDVCTHLPWMDGDPQEGSLADLNAHPFREAHLMAIPHLGCDRVERSGCKERHAAYLVRSVRDHGLAPGPDVPIYNYLWGSFPEMYKKGAIPYLMDTWRKYGSDGTPVRVQFGPKSLYIITDPHDINEILIEKEKNFSKGFAVKDLKNYLAEQAIGFLETGEQWLNLRKTMFPHFAAASNCKEGRVKGVQDYIGDMVRRSRAFIRRLEDKNKVDLESEMAIFTMQTISANMLGLEIPATRLEGVHSAFQIVLEFINYRLVHDPFVNPMTWLPTAYNEQYRRAFAVIKDLIWDMFREDERLEQQGAGGGTLIRTLRTAGPLKKGEPFTDPQRISLTGDSVVDQVMNIFFAGHETTTHALSMAVYHLSQEPEVQKKALGELQSILGGKGLDIENMNSDELKATLQNLPYLEAVIHETLRLHPSAPGIVRVAREEVEVGEYRMPKDSVLFIFFQATHQLRAYWWDPEKFDPDRFLVDGEQTHHPCGMRHSSAFTPFGQGKRICMGRFFALQEMKIFLAELLQSAIQFHVAPGAKIEVVASPTFRLQEGLPMVFEGKTLH